MKPILTIHVWIRKVKVANKVKLFNLITLSLIFSSCVSNKKLQMTINAFEQAEKATQARIDNGITTPEVGKEIKDNLTAEKSEIQKARDKKPIARLLDFELIKRVNSSFTTLEMLQKVYNIETFKTFESAKFYKSGQYIIPPEYESNILSDLNPLIDKIIQTFEKDEKKEIKIVIAISGYSDAQSISTNSSLYKQLADSINHNNPSQEELNLKLSELRAQSLAKLIDKAVKNRKNESQNKVLLTYDIRFYGRGTQLPDKIVSPLIDDPRRRVVKVMWDINPFVKNNK